MPGLPHPRPETGFPQPALHRRPGETQEVAVELGRHRHAPVHASAQEPECARRLAVHDIERPGCVQLVEGRRGRPQPVAVPEWPPRLPRGGVLEMPDAAEVLRLRETVQMPGRDDLDLVAGLDEPPAEIGRVRLHPSDPMGIARNGDDADPHGGPGISTRLALCEPCAPAPARA